MVKFVVCHVFSKCFRLQMIYSEGIDKCLSTCHFVAMQIELAYPNPQVISIPIPIPIPESKSQPRLDCPQLVSVPYVSVRFWVTLQL